MGQLIDALLGLANLTRSRLHLETVDLSAIAAGVVERLRASSPDREVEVRIDPGLSARGDAGLLLAVFENLLGNAWKFTSKKPVANISFGRAGAAFFVKDDGAGFEMQYARKLFGAFQRLHGKHEFEGTGIGLATVQRIVHRHGGRVWAEAAPGKGATFHFTLGS
jgi:light-regulated signal transduction histidine kinase (bacteriophytochrome)